MNNQHRPLDVFSQTTQPRVSSEQARAIYEALQRAIAIRGSARAAQQKPTPPQNGRAEERELLTAADVARMLAIGERSVWRKAQDGRLPPPIKVGGSTRWAKTSIRDWIEHLANTADNRLPRRLRRGK
jgi:predicted DNA-binding transcriptional regulator AlpA